MINRKIILVDGLVDMDWADDQGDWNSKDILPSRAHHLHCISQGMDLFGVAIQSYWTKLLYISYSRFRFLS